MDLLIESFEKNSLSLFKEVIKTHRNLLSKHCFESLKMVIQAFKRQQEIERFKEGKNTQNEEKEKGKNIITIRMHMSSHEETPRYTAFKHLKLTTN